MRRKLFVVGLLVAGACLLLGFTAIDDGKQVKSTPCKEQVVDKCKDKNAKGECKHQEQACDEQCKQKCEQQCKEECKDKASCAEKHAAGGCKGHEPGTCKGQCQKSQPKKDEKK